MSKKMVVYKQILEPYAHNQKIRIPIGSKLLTIEVQRNIPIVYYLVNNPNPDDVDFENVNFEDVNILQLSTGEFYNYKDPCSLESYVGTYTLDGYVTHVFLV